VKKKMSRRFRIPGRRKRTKRREPQVRIPIEREGALTRYGYSTALPADERREALDQAVDEHGALTVWRMLNAQVVFRKGARDQAEDEFVADRDYIKKRYLGKKQFSLKD